MLVGNIVLFGWPVVMVILFAKFDRPKAIAASILFGYLFLPEMLYFDLPMVPTLNKHSIPAIVALIFVLVFKTKDGGKILPDWMPKAVLPRFLMALLIFSSFMTVMTNSDPLIFGPVYLPALRPYDALAVILSLLVTLIPFLLARKYLAYPEQQRMLLGVFVFAGFIYAFLALFEVRMSPQLNNMLYGFFPHSFDQHIRPGGFRPLVFLNHGLWLAIFFAGTILAAFSLARTVDADERWKYIAVGLWLLLTLSLSNSLGALVIAVILLPVAMLFGTRTQVILCAVLALIILLYPALRGAGLIPIDAILGWAQGVSPDRAHSLAFRLANEDLLLSRAQERPIFGWGGFGRSMVFDEFGVERTITDGYWIIVVGQGGWARYLAEFGLLCLPAVIAALSFRKSQFGFETTGLMLMLIANLIDLVPNATITPLTWIVVGSIWGRIELGRVSEAEAEALDPISPKIRATPVYTRFNGTAARKVRADDAPPKVRYARRNSV
jgi:hypothetical protein